MADVWGFDENAVKVLKSMKPVDYDLTRKFEILLNNRNKKKEDEVRDMHQTTTLRTTVYIIVLYSVSTHYAWFVARLSWSENTTKTYYTATLLLW